MRLAVSILTILFLSAPVVASAQSLAEIARKERERREKLRDKSAKSFDEKHLGRVHFGRRAIFAEEGPEGTDDEGRVTKATRSTSATDADADSETGSAESPALASFQETDASGTKDVEFLHRFTLHVVLAGETKNVHQAGFVHLPRNDLGGQRHLREQAGKFSCGLRKVPFLFQNMTV